MLNYSPIINQRLKGDESEPYIATQENLTIKNQKVQLSGVPDYLTHVYIDGMNEIYNGLPKENEFIVDYKYGYVTFNLANDNQNINVSYNSTGCSFFPANRVYTQQIDGEIVETLDGVIQSAQTAINGLEQLDIAIDAKQKGLKGDGSDDSIKFEETALYCATNSKQFYFPNGTYLIKATSLSSNKIKGCSMIGESLNNTIIILDGQIGFDTEDLDNIHVENITFILRNAILTDVDLPIHTTAIFYSLTPKKKIIYKNLIFNGEVTLDDGSQRYQCGIRDGCTEIGVIDNIVFKNIANNIIISSDSNNYNIKNITTYNFQTAIQAGGTNYHIDNINGYNTPAQATIWLQKNHPTQPVSDYNGMDLVLCGGSHYTLANLTVENPIERTIYSTGTDVTAYNLRSLNGDGIKFAGSSLEAISKNIKVSDVFQKWDENNIKNTLGAIATYWTEEIMIDNVQAIWVGGKLPMSAVFVNRSVKNITINNVVADGFSYSLLTVDMKSDVGLLPDEYLVLENATIKNCTAKKNYLFTGTLFGTRTTGASADALNNYASKNVSVENCSIEYGDTKDRFWYNYSYCNGFYAHNNKANKFAYENSGILEVAPAVINNIILKEEGILSNDISRLIQKLFNTFKASKGSYLSFQRINDVDEKISVEVEYNNILTTAIDTPTTINASCSKLKIRGLNNKAYCSFAFMPSSYVIKVITNDGGFYVSKVSNSVKSDIVGTFPITLTFSDVDNGVTIRGDQYSQRFFYEIEAVL